MKFRVKLGWLGEKIFAFGVSFDWDGGTRRVTIALGFGALDIGYW